MSNQPVERDFFLQFGKPDNPNGFREERLFLDDRHHPGCQVEDVIRADSWIQARIMVVGF